MRKKRRYGLHSQVFVRRKDRDLCQMLMDNRRRKGPKTDLEVMGDLDKISSGGNLLMGVNVGKNARLCCKAKFRRQELVVDVGST